MSGNGLYVGLEGDPGTKVLTRPPIGGDQTSRSLRPIVLSYPSLKPQDMILWASATDISAVVALQPILPGKDQTSLSSF